MVFVDSQLESLKGSLISHLAPSKLRPHIYTHIGISLEFYVWLRDTLQFWPLALRNWALSAQFQGIWGVLQPVFSSMIQRNWRRPCTKWGKHINQKWMHKTSESPGSNTWKTDMIQWILKRERFGKPSTRDIGNLHFCEGTINGGQCSMWCHTMPNRLLSKCLRHVAGIKFKRASVKWNEPSAALGSNIRM